MTETAIDVIVVEGCQIDWTKHNNDAAWAMSDVAAFEEVENASFAINTVISERVNSMIIRIYQN